jgi:hypothetical protein
MLGLRGNSVENKAAPTDSLQKNIPKKEHPHRDLSTTLRSGFPVEALFSNYSLW